MGRFQGKKGRKNFCGGVYGKWGIVFFGVKSLLEKDKILLHTHLIRRSLSTYLGFYLLPNATQR